MTSQRTVNAFYSLEVPGRLVDELVTLQKSNPEHIDPHVEFNAEISSVHSEIVRTLDLPAEEYRPHSTLGLARGDVPYTWTEALRVPAEREPSPALRLHQSVGGEFRLLARRELTGA